MGWRPEDKLKGSVKDIIEGLKPGDISPVLEDGTLYSIIKLQDKKEATAEEFTSVKRIISKNLYKEKYQELYRSHIEKLKADADIKLNDEVIESIVQAFGKS